MYRYQKLPIQRCLRGESVSELSDAEILAIILHTGVKGKNVMECAFSLLHHFGSMNGLYDAGIREIAAVSGMGLMKAVRIKAAMELGKRLIVPRPSTESIDNPRLVWENILADIVCNKQEEFWVMILDTKNRLVKKKKVSVGTISEAIVHPREIFRDAIREAASSVIMIHNHPSGVLKPSVNDIQITKRIVQAGAIIGIQLLDHVIVTEHDYLSLRELDESLFEVSTC